MHRPLIGVNVDALAPKSDKLGRRFYFLNDRYLHALKAGGADVILLPPHENEDTAHQLLNLVDGMLFIGGADLDPHRDGWQRHSTTVLLDPERESWDRMLMRLCGLRRKPVFGIGAGMQLMAVSFGGNLMLHIPIDRPKALKHWDPLDPAHRHLVEISSPGFFADLFSEFELRVNSSHHMAVDELPSNFKASLRSPDGITEAIESGDSNWFAIGTQFHPEIDTGSILQRDLFKTFIEAVKAEACPIAGATSRLQGAGNGRVAV